MLKTNFNQTSRTRGGLYGLVVVVWLALGLVLSGCGGESTPLTLATATPGPTTAAATATTAATAVPTTAAATTAAAVPTTAAATTAAAVPTTAATTAAPATTRAATTSVAATPAATTGSGTPGSVADNVPTVKVPDSARQVVNAISKQTEKTRSLTFKTPVETNFMTRADLTKYQQAEFTKNNPPENIARDEKILKVFGFAPKNFDFAKTYIDLLNEQVIGFYDTETKKLYIITDTDPSKVDPLAKFTAEHELTHALQDQFFDLQNYSPTRKPEDKEWSDDASTARLALIEGDAVQSQLNWISGGNLSQAELQELIKSSQSSNSNVLDNAPLILSEGLLFPYNDGNVFVKSLYDKGGWDAVNKAYTDYPPKSTAQILHPIKYQNKVEPVKINLPSITGILGSGWKSLDINTNGELAARIWLQTGMSNFKDSASKTAASRAVKGWAGDRYEAVENAQGQVGLVWRTQWDSEAEATDFFNAASGSVKNLFGVSGNGTGTDLKKSWSNADQDVSLIRKGKEVLVQVLPKGTGVDKIASSLGF
jgi:hypothetical protein